VIEGVRALGAPYGGAVRLIVTSSNSGGLSALILATDTATAPDPVARTGARVVHSGQFREWGGANSFTATGAAYQAMDLSTDDLPDDTAVYYHVFEMLPLGSYGPRLLVSATPGCVRQATVVLIRDMVRSRLAYHTKRGIRDGVLPAMRVIPILEQEVLEEGFSLPAILLKESSSPNPGAETIGKGPEDWNDLFDGHAYREYTHATNARVDLLVLSNNPEERGLLEKFLHGVLTQDIDYFQAAGLEGVDIQRSIRHDVDPAGANYYNIELTVSGTANMRVREELTYAVTDNIARAENG
jgi:hypothetical protein